MSCLVAWTRKINLLRLHQLTSALVSDARDRSAAMQKMAFWTLPLELTSRWKLVFASTSMSIAQTCCPFPPGVLCAFARILTAIAVGNRGAELRYRTKFTHRPSPQPSSHCTVRARLGRCCVIMIFFFSPSGSHFGATGGAFLGYMESPPRLLRGGPKCQNGESNQMRFAICDWTPRGCQDRLRLGRPVGAPPISLPCMSAFRCLLELAILMAET